MVLTSPDLSIKESKEREGEKNLVDVYMENEVSDLLSITNGYKSQ